MTNGRNDKTADALQWLAQASSQYVTGDWSHDELVGRLRVAIHDGLSDDFGPVVRQLDTVATLRSLRDALTQELDEQVRQGRGMGATWEQVGTALGTTKQAAQQRYGS